MRESEDSDSREPARAVGFVGASGSGKTTLLERLVTFYSASGVRVTVLKHTHHAAPFTTGEGDTGRLFRSGAVEALLVSDNLALLESDGSQHEWRSVEELRRLIPPSDLILVEGFRSLERLARIAVVREESHLRDVPAGCIAVVSDLAAAEAWGIPRFRFAALSELAAFVLAADTIEL